MATSDLMATAVPAYGNPNFRGIGSTVVRSVNESFESAQAGVVPYVTWTEIDADLFAENPTDWEIEIQEVSVETPKRGRPKQSR